MANSDQGEAGPPGQSAAASPEKPPASPHDTLVYKILSDPVLAAAELRAVLPPEIVKEISWKNLELDRHRFVTGNLDNQYTDLLYKTTIRGRDIRIRILLEHSSYAKPYELLQALQYQVRQWECDVQEKKAANTQRLTPILTVILHHSETGWRGRTRFIDYFGLDEDLAQLFRPYVVDFGIVLDDVSKVNTEALLERPVPPEVQILLFALRHGRSERKVLDELPKLAPVLTALLKDPYGKVAVHLFIVYIRRVAKVSEADMRTVFQEFIEPHLDPEMVAIWTQFEDGLKEGERRGELKGERTGELKGARTTLRRLLEQRFGVLSLAQSARLDSSSLGDLDAMTLRVLTAATIDEVLDG